MDAQWYSYSRSLERQASYQAEAKRERLLHSQAVQKIYPGILQSLLAWIGNGLIHLGNRLVSGSHPVTAAGH